MLRLVGRILVLVCFPASLAFAQPSAVITGVVTDTSGAMIPGVLVDAGGASGPAAAVRTDADGRYRLVVTAGQTYLVRARLPGFADASTEVTAAGETTRNLTLRVAAIGDTLVVTASRTGETRAVSAEAVTVVSAADIDALGAASLGDVLRTVPGLAVETNGREGALASLFSRGGESDYNLVLVDGVRVNQTGGAFDVGRLAAADVDRVEIVRGGHSALYGSDAMGAVVQVFTRRAGPSQPLRVIGSAEGGSFDTWRGDVALLGGAGPRADYKAGLSARTTGGAFAAALPEDDRFDQQTVDTGGGVLLGDRVSLRTALRYSRARGHDVGPIAYGSRDTGTSSETSSLSWHLAAAHRWSPAVTALATVAYARSDSDVVDRAVDPAYSLYAVLAGTPGAVFPASPRLVRFVDARAFAGVSAGASPLAPGQFLANTPWGVGDYAFAVETRLRRPSFKYQADWAWHGAHALTGGYEFEGERAPLDRFAIDNHAWFAQQQFRAGDRWVLTVGARVDDNSRYGTHVAPRISAGGYVRPPVARALSSLKVFSNLGSGLKSPTIDELFGSTFTDGNLALDPERARTFDAGLEATFADQRLRGSMAFFDNRYTDQVAYRGTGFGRDGRPDYVNIAGSQARGLEVEAALQRALFGLTASGSYALVATEVTTAATTSEQFQPGQPLLRRPRHSASLRVAYVRGRVTAQLDARIVGQRHDAAFLGLAAYPSGRPVDITVNPGYTVAGVGVDYRVGMVWTAFVRVDNVADAEYEQALGYPGMPRAVMAGVRFGVGGR